MRQTDLVNEQDEKPREVDVPAELAAALAADPAALAAFEGISTATAGSTPAG